MHTKVINRKEYIKRINKVVDFIDNNIDSELNLNILANAASFSPFHFHRIFTAFMGETPNVYINRIRIEKAARILMTDEEITVSEVATICGFNSDSVFCRNFKSHFGMNSQDFIKKTLKEDDSRIRQLKSKMSQSESKNKKLKKVQTFYFRNEYINNRRSIMKKQAELKEMPPMKLAYIRHTGAFDQIEQAYQKLFKWAGPRGLLNGEFHTITVYHDDPKITEIEKLRQSACLTINEDIKPEGEIGFMELPAGKHLVGHFEIGVTEFEEAWNTMCLELADSGYQPSDGNPYELYYKDPENHPEGKFDLDICIPVKAV